MRGLIGQVIPSNFLFLQQLIVRKYNQQELNHLGHQRFLWLKLNTKKLVGGGSADCSKLRAGSLTKIRCLLMRDKNTIL